MSFTADSIPEPILYSDDPADTLILHHLLTHTDDEAVAVLHELRHDWAYVRAAREDQQSGWEHALRSHPARLPKVEDRAKNEHLPLSGRTADNYWLTVEDGVLYLETICDECGYVIRKRLDLP